MTTDPPIVLNLDASLLKVSACDTRFYYVATGNRPRYVAAPLRIGSIFHRYAELRSKGTDKLDCIRRLVTPENLAFLPQEKYVEVFASYEGSQLGKLAADKYGNPLVEVKQKRRLISTPLGAVDLFVNIDRINFDGSWVDYVDYKSTGRVESAYWKFRDLENENINGVQLDLYQWFVWTYGAEFLPDEIYNTIREGRFSARICGILFNNKPAQWKLGRRFTLNTEQLYGTFEAKLRDCAQRLLDVYISGQHDETGHILNLCPSCSFNPVCRAADDSERVLAFSEFERAPYDPHNFGMDV